MSIERIIPGTIEWDAFYANHIFRYEFILSQFKKYNKRKVLDAACGVGYGSSFLAQNGIETVVGVDRSDDALTIARKEFMHQGVSFLKDDCYTLAAAGQHGPYDAIVSCETLEHLAEPDKFLSRVYELLQPGGLFVVTTPNFDFSPNRAEVWDFHEKEYTAKELTELLVKHGFDNITLYGQSYSDVGTLRSQIRAELYRTNSNPFMRFGRWIQETMRGRKFTATLPEQVNDFTLTEAHQFESNPPFVLFAVAFKK